MNFIINRSTWRCGDDGKHSLGKGYTRLLNREGFMCCLGQISLQLGCEKADIYDAGEPAGVYNMNIIDQNEIILSQQGEFKDTPLALEAMHINDSIVLTQKEREDQLKELFKNYGHTIEFINEGTHFPEEEKN